MTGSEDDIVDRLRERACQAGLPHTGDNPKDDHGHTDCWLHHQAADEIERLRALITEWADADLVKTPYGPSIHPIIEAEEALRKAVGR